MVFCNTIIACGFKDIPLHKDHGCNSLFVASATAGKYLLTERVAVQHPYFVAWAMPSPPIHIQQNCIFDQP